MKILQKNILMVIFLLIILTGCTNSIKSKSSVKEKVEISTSSVFTLTGTERKLLEIKAKQGDIKSAIRLADYYGYSVEGGYEKEFYWRNFAAKLGDPESQSWVGYYHFEKKQWQNALQWYEKAAKQGAADGEFENLLFLKNIEDNLTDYTKKAKQGDAYSSYCLYYYYNKTSGIDFYTKNEQDKRSKIAQEWLELAAKQGSAKAQFELAKFYDYSYHKKDKKKAIYWYKKASEQVMPEADRRLNELEGQPESK